MVLVLFGNRNRSQPESEFQVLASFNVSGLTTGTMRFTKKLVQQGSRGGWDHANEVSVQEGNRGSGMIRMLIGEDPFRSN